MEKYLLNIANQFEVRRASLFSLIIVIIIFEVM